MLTKPYAPALLAVDVRATEVSTFVNTMEPPGTTAPVGSRITPLIDAVETWAFAEPARNRSRRLRMPNICMPGSKLPPSLTKLRAQLFIPPPKVPPIRSYLARPYLDLVQLPLKYLPFWTSCATYNPDYPGTCVVLSDC